MNIPTFKDAEQIVNKNNSFRSKYDIIDGYKVSQYSYLLTSYSDFKKPLAKSFKSAFELRGLTFVHLGKNRYKRYLMMHKFFNLNQNADYMYNDVKDKKIEFVQEKVDGSLIRFIRLPNNKIIAKTQYSFESEQAKEAIKIYNSNKNLRNFIDYTLDNDMTALFEYVSPYNQVVLKYNETDLKLLTVRRDNGDYMSRGMIEYFAKTYNINIAKFEENLTIDEYIEKANVEENKEGWIISFTDGQRIKLKTKWYFSLHKLMTGTVNRENDLIQNIIEGKIDDLLAALPVDAIEERTKITEFTELVIPHINNIVEYVYNKITVEYTGDRKAFAIVNNKDKYFGLFMMALKNPTKESVQELVYSYVLKHTSSLNDAKKFIENIK